MDQPEAMQEDTDRDNWNEEEMLEAAVGLINWIVICRAVGIVQVVHLPLTVTVTVMVLGAW